MLLPGDEDRRIDALSPPPLSCIAPQLPVAEPGRVINHRFALESGHLSDLLHLESMPPAEILESG
jgi:hypothetical protein